MGEHGDGAKESSGPIQIRRMEPEKLRLNLRLGPELSGKRPRVSATAESQVPGRARLRPEGVWPALRWTGPECKSQEKVGLELCKRTQDE